MFKYIRVQIVHPCRAKCAWCSTHHKNPTFQKLHDNGLAEDYHETYAEVIERYKPEEVFVSGGEPLLYPQIGEFLKRISEHTNVIHVFTSYQFSRQVMDRIAQMELPDKVILNHTPIYFEPDRWHKLTRGFPFEVYRDNVRKAARLPIRKRFKFIINHNQFVQEISRFQELIEPDETCEISLKIMNDQGNGLVVEHMQRTAQNVFDRLNDLDSTLTDAGWANQERPSTSADLMKPVIESGDVTKCVYRQDPLELRLSFYRGDDQKQIIKYRYCPYFPPDFGHKFHIGRDDIEKMGKNFKKGPFREHCERCRMLHYSRTPCGQEGAGVDMDPDDVDDPDVELGGQKDELVL